MDKHQYINSLINVWGQDYIFDLIDRGYVPVEVTDANGVKSWKLQLPIKSPLTSECVCATLPSARSVVSSRFH
jgi:hypothetical protein